MSLPNLERVALDEQTNPDAHESLPRILDPHPWADGVGEAQGAGPDIVNIVVKNVILLTRDLVHAVDVHRAEQMILVNGEVLRFAVNLASAGVDDFDGGDVFAAGFHDWNLGAGNHISGGVRAFHRNCVCCLPRYVENAIST